jgi:polyhydroxyalkanoate synthesis regulator phasin
VATKKKSTGSNTVPKSSMPFGGQPIKKPTPKPTPVKGTNLGNRPLGRVITTPSTSKSSKSTSTAKKSTSTKKTTTASTSKPIIPPKVVTPKNSVGVTPVTPFTPRSTSWAFPTTPDYNPGYGQYGNPASPDGSSVSSVYPTGRDTLSMAQLQAQFGIAAAVLANNPSLVEALNKILGVGGGPMITDPALQEAIIKGTSWYRDQTDTQRTYDYYKATNPGQFAADLQSNASSIVKQWASMGLNITADQAIEYANNMMKQAIIKDGKVVRFDQDYLNKLMSESIKFTKTGETSDGVVRYTGLAGKLETMANELYKRAWDYGFPQTMSNDAFGTWFESNIKGLVAGTTNPEDVDNLLQERAKTFAPGLARFIDQGQTLRQAADPWLNAIASTWEVDVNSLSLNDDYVQRAINFQDEKGNFSTMNLYDTKKLARRSGKWDMTQAAKEEKTNIASRILQDFGFLG